MDNFNHIDTWSII